MRIIEIIHALRKLDADQDVFFIHILPKNVVDEFHGQPSFGLSATLPMDDIQLLENDSDSMADEILAIGTFKKPKATH